MYNIVEDIKYFVLDRYYDTRNNRDKIFTFDSKEKLIDWLASVLSFKRDVYIFYGGPYYEFDFTGKDSEVVTKTESTYTWDIEESRWRTSYNYYKSRQLKRYLVVREDDVIVDVRLFEKEVLELKEERARKHASKIWYYTRYETEGAEQGEVFSIAPNWRDIKQTYKYRQGPVPNIRKRRNYGGNTKKFYRLFKQSTDPEYGKYMRNKAKLTAIEWDWEDYYRHIDKSWKTNTKNRHQWEKNSR